MTGLIGKLRTVATESFDWCRQLNFFEWATASLSMVVSGILLSTMQIDFTLFAHMLLILSTIASVVVAPLILYYYHAHNRFLIVGLASMFATNIMHLLAGGKFFLALTMAAPVADIFLSFSTLSILAIGLKLSRCSCEGMGDRCAYPRARRKTDRIIDGD